MCLSKRNIVNMSRSRSSKKKSNLKHLYILVFVVAALAGGYYYIEKLEKESPQTYITAPLTGEEGSPQYSILENTDSVRYQTIVIYNKDVSINDVAETFYDNEVLWPYIYLENKGDISNPLDIKKDVVLRIPRLSSVHIDDAKSLNRAKQLADSILSKPVSQESY